MEEFQTLVLPFRTVVLQFLFLLVAIAIEGAVLHNRLGISKRGGIQYAMTLNLISTVFGWTVFFSVERFLSDGLRLDLMSFVLFNQTFSFSTSLPTLVVIGVFAVFIGTFIVESQILNLLLLLWSPPRPDLKYDTSEMTYSRNRRYRTSWTARLRAGTLLRANALSYGAIAILLFVLQRSAQL